MTQKDLSANTLTRTLGLWPTISIVIGSVIGSGIFLKPSLMASQLGSPVWLVLVWIVAGLITLCGALSNAEVAAMLPETGGQYVFFRYMYGDFVAFLYGWAAFAVINTASIASIAYVAGTYAEYFITLPRLSLMTEHSIFLSIPFIGTIYPLENIGVKLFTISAIVILTIINYRSTRSSGALQVLFTAVKTGAIILLIVGIFSFGKGNVSNFFTNSIAEPTGWAFVAAIVAAMSGAFWAYDGWNNITFVAGEIKDPQHTIPKSLLVGLLCCIAVYAAITLSYLFVLPVTAMARSTFVASEAAQLAIGGLGGTLIALLVIISVIGATNAFILATTRITFAMAQRQQFFSWTSFVHPSFGTPGNALVLHCVWSCLLVLSGSFDMLTDMVVFITWMFYGLSTLGIFKLRKKMPEANRPYKVWGYPFVPAVFLVFTSMFLAITLSTEIYNYATGVSRVINSVFGLLLVCLGIPFYWYFKRKTGSEGTIA